MKINVRIEEVEIIFYESLYNSMHKIYAKVGIFPDGFEEFDALYEQEIDEGVYWWFSEVEFEQVIERVCNTSKLYPLDNEEFIYAVSNDNKPFEITLEKGDA